MLRPSCSVILLDLILLKEGVGLGTFVSCCVMTYRVVRKHEAAMLAQQITRERIGGIQRRKK